jgi:hypothetical protein
MVYTVLSPPSIQSPQRYTSLKPEMNHKHKERKMYKHMEEIKLSRKVAEFIFTLRELSSRLANLYLLEKASGSSELLSSGKCMVCDSYILYLFSHLKLLRVLQEEHFSHLSPSVLLRGLQFV